MVNQKKWVIFTVLIGTYGFLKNISPECPYIAEFFLGTRFNFTTTLMTQEVYPVLAYAGVIQTFIVLLVTDILRYKPIIVIGAFGIVLHKALLVWGQTLLEIQATQFFLGLSKSCNLAYKTYIYTKVDTEHFQMVTAVIRIAPKAGTLFSAILAQVALSVFLVKIELLNIISLVASVMTVTCAIMLPSLKPSNFYNDEIEESQNCATENWHRYRNAVKLLWQDFKEAYTNPHVLGWCIWWIFATGGFQQVSDYYVQVLWSDITQVKQNKYNAGVEAVYTTVSAIACYFIGRMKIDWHKHRELLLGTCTLLKGAVLLYSAFTHSIVIAYAIYIIFCTLYDIMMVISNSEVAKHLKNNSFALIFGINTFLALCCQALLTYVISSKCVFAFPIQKQFISIGCGFLVLGIFFAVKAIFKKSFGTKTITVVH